MVIGNFWYCSINYVRDWFTLLLHDQNPLLDLGRNQIFVIWMQYSYYLIWCPNILGKQSSYLPTHWRNGGSGVVNEHIFKGGPNNLRESDKTVITFPTFLWSLFAASSWKCFHSLNCLVSGKEIPYILCRDSASALPSQKVAEFWKM